METKQTAIDYLYHIVQMGHYISKADWERARQMEREQINKAAYDGYYREGMYDIRKYYNDTYETK